MPTKDPAIRKEISRRYHRNHREKERVACQQWRLRNPDKTKAAGRRNDAKRARTDARRAQRRDWWARNKEIIAAKRRIRYGANRDKHRERSKKYAADHRIEAVTRATKWYKDNKEKSDQYHHLRRAKQAGSGGNFSPAEWRAMKELYGNKCLRCKKSEPDIKLTLDHIIPIVRGGPHVWDNIQPLCYPCNSGKRDKIKDYRPIRQRRTQTQTTPALQNSLPLFSDMQISLH